MATLKRHIMRHTDGDGLSAVLYDPISASANSTEIPEPGSASAYYFTRAEGCPPFNWEVTTACTWRCAHCFQSTQPVGADRAVAISQSQVDRAVTLLGTSGACEVSITGGEPLLARNLAEVLDAVRGELPDIRIRVLASGRGLLERAWMGETLDALARVGATVRLPLYGASSGAHDAITGVSRSLDDVRAFARELRERGVRFVFGVGVFEDTADELPETIAAASELGCREVAVSTIVYPPKGRAATRDRAPAPVSPGSLMQLLSKAPTAALATQYISLESQCASGCQYPTIDATGTLHDCDVISSPSASQDAWTDPVRATPPGCADCELAPVCRRCLAFAAQGGCSASHRDCVAAAAFVVGRRAARALAHGFAFVDPEAAQAVQPYIPSMPKGGRAYARR